jgi:hypothetical protein
MWEETSSEELELPSSNSCNNVESTNVDQEQRETNSQIFDVDGAEIIRSTLDYNPCTSTATDTGSENMLNAINILCSKKFCNGQTYQRKSLKDIQRGCHF